MIVPAVGMTEFGGPEVLKIVDVAVAEPGPEQVKVQVRAATVNPTDTLLRSGALSADGTASWPVVPGMDFAGIVLEVGEGSRWQVGDHVIGVLLPGARPGVGGYASQVVVGDDSIVRAPHGRAFSESATLLMNGLTAYQALDRLDLPEGAIVGVTGAAGAVGGYAVGLAKARGLRVIADGAAKDETLLRLLGADEVVERGDGVADRMVEAAGGPLDGIVDASLQGPSLLSAVRDGGGFAAVRQPDWESERGITVHFVTVPTYFTDQERMTHLRDLVDSDEIPLRVSRVIAAEEAPEAHRLLEKGGLRGRVVLEWPPA